jgi:hypothetical protein
VDDERFHRGHLQEPAVKQTLFILAALGATVVAQQPPTQPQAARQEPPTASQPAPPVRQAVQIDVTGYWVSFVTEDWRFRMIMPPKGDYARVPLTPEGRKVADAWNPAADQAAGAQCKAYGVGGIMRVPGRIHITWQDDNTLHLEFDAGTQTRELRFAPSQAARERTWQGHSSARWEPLTRSLRVTTTNFRAGYLRRNGVPYSENAVITEYFDVAPHPDGSRLLVVTTRVEDPRFLERPFIVSSHFKEEKDGSKWNPRPCSATW